MRGILSRHLFPHSWPCGHPVPRRGVLDTGEALARWSRWPWSRDTQSSEKQSGIRRGLTVPQVEHGNEAEWPGCSWLGWDAWVNVYRTDAAREWADDTDFSVGRLDKALTEADEKGWTVVGMQQDWSVAHPPEKT